MDESILDDMHLPWANHNEDLETLSENRLKPLFKLDEFHFCTSDRRDKGIDITYEIKRHGKHAGFRFILQLKATESITPNADGSFSLQLDTSNINYLLNQNPPAFYILYVAEANVFYYRSMKGLLLFLQSKSENWAGQKSHTIKFSEILNPSACKEMYQAALQFGLMQRTLKEQSAYISSSLNVKERISLDADYNITGDDKIRRQIEKIGLGLINEGEWNTILALHKNATGQLKRSALYNLILGVAQYYGGNRIEALSFIKESMNLKSELDDDLKNYLTYFDATIRYSLGMLSELNYNAFLSKLEGSGLLGLYLTLENAKDKYIKSIADDVADGFEIYNRAINSLLENISANENLRLAARCDLALFEGYRNNTDYLSGVAQINQMDETFGVVPENRVPIAKKFLGANENWTKKVEAIITEAKTSNNSFILYTALINYVKVSYQFDVFSKFVYVVKPLPGYPKQKRAANMAKLDTMQKRIGLAVHYFTKIGHVENIIVASGTLYEILHYVENYELAEKVIAAIEDLADRYELKWHKEQLAALKNGGTNHEKIKKWVDGIFEGHKELKEEHERLVEEMSKMDERESQNRDRPEDALYYITLFPIGTFQFPQEKKQTVYEILNVSAAARKIFDNRFGDIIAVANIFHLTIEEEGYQDTYGAYKGIESWRHIHRVRKAFYENAFYRTAN